MQSNSAKRKLRAQLLRRVQVDTMRENFREVGADKKTIARPDQNTIKWDSTFAQQETMVDFFTAVRGRYHGLSQHTETIYIECSVCREDVRKEWSRIVERKIVCRSCDTERQQVINRALQLGEWNYYGA